MKNTYTLSCAELIEHSGLYTREMAAKQSSIRVVINLDPKLRNYGTHPTSHSSSQSLLRHRYVGKSFLASHLDSSFSINQSEDAEVWMSKFPLLSKPNSKRTLSDLDSELLPRRPGLNFKRSDGFRKSIKNLDLSYTRSKATATFNIVASVKSLQKLENAIPEVGGAMVTPVITEQCPSAKLQVASSSPSKPDSSVLSAHLPPHPTSQSPKKLRRETGQRSMTLFRSFDRSSSGTGSPSPVHNQSTRISPFSELIEKDTETIGAYPYLSAACRSKPLITKLVHKKKPSPVKSKKKKSTPCTCSAKQYIQTCLHYQQLFLQTPITEINWQHLPNLYLLYMNRCERVSHPLTLVLSFDGLIGDWNKQCLHDNSAFSLRLRKQAVSGLLLLQQQFRLVYMSRMPRKRSLNVLGYFRAYGINFSAAYRLSQKCQHMAFQTNGFLRYDRIEADLSLPGTFSNRVLVVSSLHLNYDDLESPQPDLLFHRRGSKLALLADYLPISVSDCENLPLTLLVPGMQSQSSFEILGFDQIAKSIVEYGETCGQDWNSGFDTKTQRGFYAFSTSVVHEILMTQALPRPRAGEFTSPELKRHICSLHNRLAWDTGPSLHLFTNNILLLTTRPRPSTSLCFDIIETKTAILRTGFFNLMHYTLTSYT